MNNLKSVMVVILGMVLLSLMACKPMEGIVIDHIAEKKPGGGSGSPLGVPSGRMGGPATGGTNLPGQNPPPETAMQTRSYTIIDEAGACAEDVRTKYSFEAETVEQAVQQLCEDLNSRDLECASEEKKQWNIAFRCSSRPGQFVDIDGDGSPGSATISIDISKIKSVIDSFVHIKSFTENTDISNGDIETLRDRVVKDLAECGPSFLGISCDGNIETVYSGMTSNNLDMLVVDSANKSQFSFARLIKSNTYTQSLLFIYHFQMKEEEYSLIEAGQLDIYAVNDSSTLIEKLNPNNDTDILKVKLDLFSETLSEETVLLIKDVVQLSAPESWIMELSDSTSLNFRRLYYIYRQARNSEHLGDNPEFQYTDTFSMQDITSKQALVAAISKVIDHLLDGSLSETDKLYFEKIVEAFYISDLSSVITFKSDTSNDWRSTDHQDLVKSIIRKSYQPRSQNPAPIDTATVPTLNNNFLAEEQALLLSAYANNLMPLTHTKVDFMIKNLMRTDRVLARIFKSHLIYLTKQDNLKEVYHSGVTIGTKQSVLEWLSIANSFKPEGSLTRERILGLQRIVADLLYSVSPQLNLYDFLSSNTDVARSFYASLEKLFTSIKDVEGSVEVQHTLYSTMVAIDARLKSNATLQVIANLIPNVSSDDKNDTLKKNISDYVNRRDATLLPDSGAT